uniref:Uncharacterized protein n=1 Tax=Corethron hystrix TaxID=216773 RepID=A0A7S1FX16_9STRA|mmetsp:Transcript_389/g.812  ORF Transcript_389/g.812 Transcript_389/m.812 type:complete len:259 (+) Transcript_389:265-1041(+)
MKRQREIEITGSMQEELNGDEGRSRKKHPVRGEIDAQWAPQQLVLGQSLATDHVENFLTLGRSNCQNMDKLYLRENINPQTFAETIIRKKGLSEKLEDSLSVDNFFLEPCEESIAAYKSELIQAVRSDDVPMLRVLHREGHPMHACNQFGESVLHMACRKGYTDTVRFLIHEAKVSLRIRDDLGRNPMHDAFWAQKPNYSIIDMILDKEPGLLLCRDKRGHGPLNYVRREHWCKWNEFLEGRENKIIQEKKVAIEKNI